MCEVVVAVDEFEAGGDESLLEGVTEVERGWYEGAVAVFE